MLDMPVVQIEGTNASISSDKLNWLRINDLSQYCKTFGYSSIKDEP